MIENVKRRQKKETKGQRENAELEEESVEYCQPSTSKSSVTNVQQTDPVGDPENWIDIEEMKIEDIKLELSSQRTTENSDREGEDDEIFFSSMKSPKRSKRKLFVGLKETPAFLMEEQIPNEEGSDDSVSILTNHCDEPIGGNNMILIEDRRAL